MARKHNIKESYPDTQGKDEYSGVQIIVYVSKSSFQDNMGNTF